MAAIRRSSASVSFSVSSTTVSSDFCDWKNAVFHVGEMRSRMTHRYAPNA